MKTTFSDFVQPPSFPVAANPTPPPLLLLLPCFIWLSRWSCHIWCAILLNDIMDLQMLSLGTLVPEGPWCVFYTKMHQLYWGTLVLWFDVTHTHTQHSPEASRLTHHLLSVHSSSLYYTEWIVHWYQEFTFHNVLKHYSHVKVIFLLIRCYKTRFFLWNTKSSDRNGVNEQNTHT